MTSNRRGILQQHVIGRFLTTQLFPRQLSVTTCIQLNRTSLPSKLPNFSLTKKVVNHTFLILSVIAGLYPSSTLDAPPRLQWSWIPARMITSSHRLLKLVRSAPAFFSHAHPVAIQSSNVIESSHATNVQRRAAPHSAPMPPNPRGNALPKACPRV